MNTSWWIKQHSDGTAPDIVAAVTDAQAKDARDLGLERAKVRFLNEEDPVWAPSWAPGTNPQSDIAGRLQAITDCFAAGDASAAAGLVETWLGEISDQGGGDVGEGGDADAGGDIALVLALPSELPAFEDHGRLWEVMEAPSSSSTPSLLDVSKADVAKKKEAWGEKYDKTNALLRKMQAMYVASRLMHRASGSTGRPLERSVMPETPIVNKQSLYGLAAGLFGGTLKDHPDLKNVEIPTAVQEAYFGAGGDGQGGGGMNRKPTGTWLAAAEALLGALGPAPARAPVLEELVPTMAQLPAVAEVPVCPVPPP